MLKKEEVYTKLQTVFRDVFDDRRIRIDASTTSTDIIGWDSLMHIQLIDAIQDEFDIKFTVEDAANMKNVGELADKILKMTE